MTPPEVVTLLNEGLAAVVTVAGMVFLVIVGIAALQYMRRAVGGGSGATWVDSKGNEYASEADADEADARASRKDEDAQWAELNARTDLKEFEKDRLYAEQNR